jgi:hypothetical protein
LHCSEQRILFDQRDILTQLRGAEGRPTRGIDKSAEWFSNDRDHRQRSDSHAYRYANDDCYSNRYAHADSDAYQDGDQDCNAHTHRD